ncbi:MAG: hypothetical protein AMQ74_01886 [Candidatus Methanofastidiosum methylothiophilum]|uniref:Uncharacterized protein n=1 Tax=Candidatus Methanofastidiosum methylothiophilum TaxID=1705564 RepID=A0A150ILC5_9EURY|nr:MAG: hypothetical protein AMQ74_01886 [Candidatus Methanofastidiosum methylthiophilus]
MIFMKKNEIENRKKIVCKLTGRVCNRPWIKECDECDFQIEHIKGRTKELAKKKIYLQEGNCHMLVVAKFQDTKCPYSNLMEGCGYCDIYDMAEASMKQNNRICEIVGVCIRAPLPKNCEVCHIRENAKKVVVKVV